uniref:Uncharacterized protein n=1 Tax=Crocodylus porosus TaxID=8502 RepID=A0A7M4FE14_CROPO
CIELRVPSPETKLVWTDCEGLCWNLAGQRLGEQPHADSYSAGQFSASFGSFTQPCTQWLHKADYKLQRIPEGAKSDAGANEPREPLIPGTEWDKLGKARTTQIQGAPGSSEPALGTGGHYPFHSAGPQQEPRWHWPSTGDSSRDPYPKTFEFPFALRTQSYFGKCCSSHSNRTPSIKRCVWGGAGFVCVCARACSDPTFFSRTLRHFNPHFGPQRSLMQCLLTYFNSHFGKELGSYSYRDLAQSFLSINNSASLKSKRISNTIQYIPTKPFLCHF